MYSIYPQIILSLTIALYLFDRFRKKRTNFNVLFWSIGFFFLAFTGLVQFMFMVGLLASLSTATADFIRLSLYTIALLFIYSGVIRLISENFILRYLLPIAFLLFIFVAGYMGIYSGAETQSLLLVSSAYSAYDLGMGILFLLLYTRLSFIKEGFRNNLGPFLIALGWFIHAVNIGRLYFFLDKPEMQKWIFIFAMPYLLWLVGLILLDKETKKVFENHLKIHGLREKVGRE